LLKRFRRILAPPGRPAEALGVPAAGADLEGELVPVLAGLDPIGAEASAIEEQARERADRAREDAARDAAGIVARARARADAERARATSKVEEEAERAAAVIQVDAAHEVERIAAVRDERVAVLVSEVIACVMRSGH
jgi:hypothetical protein